MPNPTPQDNCPRCLGCGKPTTHYGDFTNHEYECGACGEFTLRVKRLTPAPAASSDVLREACAEFRDIILKCPDDSLELNTILELYDDIIDTALSDPAPAQPSGASECWFVERSPIQAPAQWWAGLDHAAHAPDLHLWTSDPHRALRFDTKEQAERAARRYFDSGIWEATDHEFVAAP